MKLTITDAAKTVGLSRSHFHMTYVKPGKITVERDDQGKPWVDTSELLRVFGKLQGTNIENTHEVFGGEHQKTLTEHNENATLQAEVRLLREQLLEAKNRETWLQAQVEKLTDTVRLLEHRPAPAPRRGFFARLFGGGA